MANHNNPLVMKLAEMLMRVFPEYDLYIKKNRVCVVFCSSLKGTGITFEIIVNPDGSLSYRRTLRNNFFILLISRFLPFILLIPRFLSVCSGRLFERREILDDTPVLPQENEIIEFLMKFWNAEPLPEPEVEKAREALRRNYFGSIVFRRRCLWLWLMIVLTFIFWSVVRYNGQPQFAPYNINYGEVHTNTNEFEIADSTQQAELYDAADNVIVPVGKYNEFDISSIRGMVVAYRILSTDSAGISKYRTDLLTLQGKPLKSLDGYYTFKTLGSDCKYLQFLGGEGSGWGVMRLPDFAVIVPQKYDEIKMYRGALIEGVTEDATGYPVSREFFRIDGTPDSGSGQKVLETLGSPITLWIIWGVLLLSYIALEVAARCRRRRRSGARA